jgi:CMP-N,N'-diacetyllegionaminic acid synthase
VTKYERSRPKGEVWALVTARSGSKGVKDKNLQQVFGHSILAWSVLAARETAGIDRVFVTTDSAAYMEEARRYGGEVPFQRPAELATDSSTDLEVFDHFLRWAAENCGDLPAAVAHLRPTTPMRDPDVIASAIERALSHRSQATALRSVHGSSESPFKWFMKDDDGYLTTLDGNRALDSANAARQVFPQVLIPNGYVDVIFPEQLVSSGRLHGDAVMPFETETVIEVDTQAELELLRKVATVPPRLHQATLHIEKWSTA